MITNLPTRESLDDVALRTYFRAWSDLIDVWTDFSLKFDRGLEVKAALREWPEEWREYLAQAQPDLQAASAMLQQAMEFALKARICAVSPYLLLLDTGVKLSASPKSIDFSELRTLDAVDLPGAVNTLTDEPIPDDFVRTYTRLRSLRNKVAHLGEAGVRLEPDEVLRQAVGLYAGVWPHRRWLADKLKFAARTRRAWLHDGKYTSAHMEVLDQWPLNVSLLRKAEFRKLFGQDKSKRRYLCHPCIDEGSTRYADLDKRECGTAYLVDEGSAVGCILCGVTFSVERRRCVDCRGDVIGANRDHWVGYCHTCGELTDEDTVEVPSRRSVDGAGKALDVFARVEPEGTD